MGCDKVMYKSQKGRLTELMHPLPLNAHRINCFHSIPLGNRCLYRKESVKRSKWSIKYLKQQQPQGQLQEQQHQQQQKQQHQQQHEYNFQHHYQDSKV